MLLSDSGLLLVVFVINCCVDWLRQTRYSVSVILSDFDLLHVVFVINCCVNSQGRCNVVFTAILSDSVLCGCCMNWHSQVWCSIHCDTVRLVCRLTRQTCSFCDLKANEKHSLLWLLLVLFFIFLSFTRFLSFHDKNVGIKLQIFVVFCVCLQIVKVLLPQQNVYEGDTCAVEEVQNIHSLYLYPLRRGLFIVACCLFCLFVNRKVCCTICVVCRITQRNRPR